MAGKALGVWNGLPTWAKGIIAVGGVAIVYFTSKSIIKRIREAKVKKEAEKATVQQSSEIKDLENAGQKASYPDSQYKSWADGIVNQFSGCDFAIENFALSNLFASYSGQYLYNILQKLNNNVDFLKLQTAFGVRTYDQCGVFNGDFTGNLTQAVNDEFSASEIEECNKLFAKKGIIYRF
jgi:hypothetical protein